MKKTLLLLIMDGYGLGKENKANAIYRANTPVIDKLLKDYPNTTLGASGLDVGLPEGQMGNSEVGHTNIGAGRVVYQDLTRISKAIKDGEFGKNPVITSAMEKAIKNDKAIHLMGLLSDGGVHSHIEHLYALLKIAKEKCAKNVYIHCFTDGRDVPPTSAIEYLKELQSFIDDLGIGKIADISGRYYAMDRDNRFDRVKLAYDALIKGEGELSDDAIKAITANYTSGVNDEFIKPTICHKGGNIKDGDSVIFYNFRPDRAREITSAITEADFKGFERGEVVSDINFVSFTRYDEKFKSVEIAFLPQSLKNTLGECLSEMGKKQLRIAETEKYAHVTFFFNGGREEQYQGEDRVLINSPNVATYDLKPEMSAVEVTNEAVRRIKSGEYDTVILNLANCDMVGHTGVMDAAIKAVETVDKCVGELVEAVLSVEGVALITSDHGNAEVMLDAEGNIVTAHSTNKVPLVVVGKNCNLRSGGVLADLAPTMLEIMNVSVPKEMDGQSLIK